MRGPLRDSGGGQRQSRTIGTLNCPLIRRLRRHLLPRRAGLSHMGEERGEEGVVPSCSLDLAFDGALVWVLSQGVEGELSDEGEVLRGMILSASVGVFGEADVENPVELVLDGPVCTGDVQDLFGRKQPR